MMEKTLRRSSWVLLVGLALLVGGAAALIAQTAAAPDAVTATPKLVKVKLENEHVRVIEAISNPGEKENMHSHPVTVVYVVAGGKLRMSTPDGKTNDVELKTGDTLYRQPVTHAAENIGTTQVHTIIVELKK